MPTPHRQAAEQVVKQLRAHYSAPHIIVLADAKQFAHLNLAAYDTYQRDLEQQGFRFLADVELIDISIAPGSVLARTMLRTMVSANGHILSSYVQVKPYLRRLAYRCLAGVLSFRPIAMLKLCRRLLKTRHYTSFETELSDGRFLTTTNAEKAVISGPPSNEHEYLPDSASMMSMLACHQQRIESVQPKVAVPLAVHSFDQMRKMQDRQKTAQDVYRESMQWITQTELQQLAGSRIDDADKVFLEVQKLLAEERQVFAKSAD